MARSHVRHGCAGRPACPGWRPAGGEQRIRRPGPAAPAPGRAAPTKRPPRHGPGGHRAAGTPECCRLAQTTGAPPARGGVRIPAVWQWRGGDRGSRRTERRTPRACGWRGLRRPPSAARPRARSPFPPGAESARRPAGALPVRAHRQSRPGRPCPGWRHQTPRARPGRPPLPCARPGSRGVRQARYASPPTGCAKPRSGHRPAHRSPWPGRPGWPPGRPRVARGPAAAPVCGPPRLRRGYKCRRIAPCRGL